ncbi:MAG: hypothetical protein AMXMBFR61_20800 [Fimbriimonadales bacterium]
MTSAAATLGRPNAVMLISSELEPPTEWSGGTRRKHTGCSQRPYTVMLSLSKHDLERRTVSSEGAERAAGDPVLRQAQHDGAGVCVGGVVAMCGRLRRAVACFDKLSMTTETMVGSAGAIAVEAAAPPAGSRTVMLRQAQHDGAGVCVGEVWR